MNDEKKNDLDPWQWIGDMFYLVVFLAGSVVIGALLLAAVVYFSGLYRVFF